ncbi:hypothetical protein [Vulgatibacter incomptus]|uniref:Uncharacterized protein n=1 Tax=Vulgatibacter incomptus TaxID=1391653 RepID=A0A0K1PA29_9BACT|nr:hypothetical protein [Vulgatibacter incomptus]AKU90357.1 hypothetical protein AKJ08_0744 [Vulgatibacter incomptus]
MVETVVVSSQNRKEGLCALMAEFFRLDGCKDVRADAPGYMAPEKIVGSLKDHAPALTCRRTDTRGTAVILDTVLVEGGAVDLSDVVSRLQLFSSAVLAIEGELHLVVPQRVGGCDGEELTRALLKRLGLRANRIWSL